MNQELWLRWKFLREKIVVWQSQFSFSNMKIEYFIRFPLGRNIYLHKSIIRLDFNNLSQRRTSHHTIIWVSAKCCLNNVPKYSIGVAYFSIQSNETIFHSITFFIFYTLQDIRTSASKMYENDENTRYNMIDLDDN